LETGNRLTHKEESLMSIFVVHSIPGSPFGRAVLAALEEKGAAYRVAAVAPGTMRTPEHLARHPFGRVPVLEHDGFSLYETQAILRYLDRVLPSPALTPTAPKAAAQMDQLLNICDWYLFQGGGAAIAFQRVVGPKLMGLTPDEAAIAAAVPKAQLAFDELSQQLGSKPYFSGDAPSLADLHIAPHLDFLSEAPEWATLTASNSNLVAWLARMRDRPSFKATTWERVLEMAKAA
jgi:glutathione S-transferase